MFRSTQGALTNIISYSLTKYLPLTVIAIISSLGPMVTVVMAYILLKERVARFEMVILLLSLVSILAFSLFPASGED